MKATLVGEVVIDRFIHADGTVTDIPGGSSANSAVALQRSGVDTALRARFSTDDVGRALRSHFSSEHLDLSSSPNAREPGSVVEVRLAADGQPSYVFRLAGAADWHWTAEELATPLPADTAVVHVGSLASYVAPGCTRIREWLTGLSPRPFISFDPNARPAAVTSDAEGQSMRAQIQAWAAVADFIKVSDEDLRWIAPDRPEAQQAAAWSQHAAFVVMTKGADGAAVFVDGALRFDVPGERVQVIDTVGAGDTFMAWLIHGVIEQLPAFDVRELAHDDERLRAIVTRSAHAAAINCSRRGCNPPYANEV